MQFNEQFLLITFLTVAVAATQSCARKTKAIALAPALAFSLAATLRKLLATLSNWRKYCPKDLSLAILLLPTPVRRAVGFHLTYRCLAPYATCLVCNTLYMLIKSCLCWGIESYDLWFWANSFSLATSILSVACHVMHSDYKLLKTTLIVFANYWWVLIEFSLKSRHLRACIPCLPCTLFPLTTECRYNITASKSVKK